MVSHWIEVIAVSRLHFGLLSFGSAVARQYGGVGAMVETPQLCLRLAPAEFFSTAGLQAERTHRAARLWVAARELGDLPACRLEVIALPPLHTGLGMGTQLALSVAAGLDAFCRLPPLPVEQLGPAMVRGLRSAVGLYGFRYGGLIAELGKSAHQAISPLHQRVELPDAWRFVLICPRGGTGLHGRSEADMFERLPPVPPAVTDELRREMVERMLPAAAAQDFAAFSESVYRYGHRAGLCYASVQGGPYQGARAQRLVDAIRAAGVCGVGQSSWGPTVYALCGDPDQAQWLTDRLQAAALLGACDVAIAPPRNRGATVRESPPQ